MRTTTRKEALSVGLGIVAPIAVTTGRTLSISRSIVETLGDRRRRTEPHGAFFRFTVPVEGAGKEQARQASAVLENVDV
jgi:hypothetical protein